MDHILVLLVPRLNSLNLLFKLEDVKLVLMTLLEVLLAGLIQVCLGLGITGHHSDLLQDSSTSFH